MNGLISQEVDIISQELVDEILQDGDGPLAVIELIGNNYRVRGFKGTGEILQDGQIIPVVFVMTGERRKTRYVLPVVSVYVPQEGE